MSSRVRRFVWGAAALCVLVAAGEAWRRHEVRESIAAGRDNLQNGNMVRALANYEHLARISPRSAAAYNGKAVVYVNQRNYDEARANFERAVRIAPKDAQKHQNYGRFLFITGNIDEAGRVFEETLRLVPFEDAVLLDLARVRLAQERSVEAESLLVRALELNPDDSTIRQLLSQVRETRP